MKSSYLLSCRTSNGPEQRVIQMLEAQGYEVRKRGWPDLIAVRGNDVRFIEVKPLGKSEFKQSQKRMAQILSKIGITVELIRA